MAPQLLPTRPLGRNGPQVPRLGLGLMGISVFYGAAKPEAERIGLLDKAYEVGEYFWDTADMYGDSEDLIGRWLKANPDKRDDIFLATKFANKPAADGSFIIDSTPEYCLSACDRSLERLGVSSVDLYYCHRLDQKTPIELTVRAMVQLKEAGKIKHLGLSECSAESLRRAHAVHPITAVQMEYSPFSLEIESQQFKLLETARELGVAVVAYSPLGRGILSGTLRSHADFGPGDFRAFLPRFSEENFPKNIAIVERIGDIAKGKGLTPSQLTLAWLLAQGDDIFPIPGTTRAERLVENLASCKVDLSDEEKRVMRKEIDDAEVAGGRYPDAFSKASFADTPALEE
ncbi:NADP-dependent oxidoreductase domain-containing protein [Dactylonectria macrodidyma]|uniref:NADP-dependent oxidoreductase domain-containing protein n=1 Tax=Dactylonectria macrodidyma TaxID=307937 RepID=A0A9P9JIK3_9HYPO|nr:NADP-dependent oxidoreductase domain-containing protein [Dactylonectria macrodidyma]